MSRGKIDGLLLRMDFHSQSVVFLGGPWRPPSPIDGSRTRCCHHTMLKARVRALAVVTVNYLGSTKTD